MLRWRLGVTLPSLGNQTMWEPKGTSQPGLLGLRCRREEQLKLGSHSNISKKSKNSPQKNAAVTGKSFFRPSLLILCCKDTVPCGGPYFSYKKKYLDSTMVSYLLTLFNIK